MDKILNYKDEIRKAMSLLAQDERVLFIGQSTLHPDVTPLFESLQDVPLSKRIELPVAEEMQMGMTLGLSLEGYIPVSVYPRVDFLMLAMNQLVNHLDKVEEMSCGRFKPKVIIRALVGSTKPLYPGPQHCQDHTKALKSLLTNINVVRLTNAERIVPAYRRALESKRSSILIELMDLYRWVPPYQK